MTSRPIASRAIVLLAGAAIACSNNASPSPPPSAGQSVTPSAPSSASPSLAAPSSAAASPSPAAFDPRAISLELEPFVDGFRNPLAAVNAGDGSGRLFVVEQGGRVLVVRDGSVLPDPLMDISDRISSGGERGLLGLAFHPQFPSDPRIFVNYTDEQGDTVIASFPVPDGGDRADVDAEEVLLNVAQPFPNHNGGAVVFGPDGMLYLALGDGGSGGDPHGNGQRLDTHLGKILRIDVDSGDPYGVPPDNPFVGRAGAEPEIWHYGLRNPWRISFDRATGELWIGDVGQGAWEEVDRAPAGVGGLNFGWNLMEGNHCFPSGDGCARPELTGAIAEYDHSVGCTVIGGHVYRGSAQPALAGGYVFADICGGPLFAIPHDAPEGSPAELVGQSGASVSSFGEDEAGEIYATDLNAGTVQRVVARPR